MPTAAETVTQVLRLANEVNTLARQHGREDLSEILSRVAARWKEDETTIVVAGAQKRGKSRLINSMLGRPGLLPVDADVATNCCLALRHGPALTAVVTDQVDGSFPIDPGRLSDYASMAGDPARRRDVVSVDVTMDHPLLQGVRLLDTPGVDSLTVGHRQVTVATLQRADALLFTLSAQDQPVLRHELEFLAEAATRVQAVAFVLTKVEDSANWQSLLAENRARLAAFAAERDTRGEPGDQVRHLLGAPWLPVSAKLYEASAALRSIGDAERAEELRLRSGMAALEDYIRGCAGARELARSATVLSAATSVLTALAAVAQDRVAAGSGDGAEPANRLADVEKALAELATTARERRRLGAGNQFLGQEVAGLVRARLAEIRRPYEEAIGELDSRAKIDRYLEQLPDSVERSLQAAWDEILDEAHTMTTQALNEFLASLGLAPAEMDLARVAMPAVRSRDLRIEPSAPARFDFLREGVPAASMAASIGLMLAHLTPVGFVVGPVLAAAVIARRRGWDDVQRNQASLRRLLAEQFAQASGDLALALQREVAGWRTAVEQTADEALAKQRRELETRRAELRSMVGEDPAGRDRARASGSTRLETITALSGRAVTLRAEIAAAVNAMNRPSV
ncbi:dynamin family protein [Planotetraspora phitsanulokensis]|uniref:Dynamin n=1 Tax=Planotetraspora phitsanulokensis TaxID=575192 RepID=A0A8J3U6Z3_9ACTN|nr:dynamin family protein [Planotetraspora phitsanulokensis]GII39325.1 dynamin [Planotetraspora phitsanulokensis]